MAPAIRVDNLSKRYRVGRKRPDRNLTESLADGLRAAWGKVRQLADPDAGAADTDDFWALQDVSFEVQPGEVVGIVGRNGAGKSTLLKILSRIVEPTGGSAEIDGRAGSLLEVGTGFHPELTGRENVYLNGTILGMSRKEIDRKFDAIVAFSGVERFLDTPVKRYSSGMMVRLGFAVAAHLEPEVLIVDEVLAVGDADFQARCIKAMDRLRREGRTVLVVSHNLTTVRQLCQTGILLDRGRLVCQAPVDDVITRYLAALSGSAGTALADRTDREGTGEATITDLWVGMSPTTRADHLYCGFDAVVGLSYQARAAGRRLEVALSVWNAEGQKLFHVDTTQRGRDQYRTAPADTVLCRLPRLPLPQGTYTINAMLKVDNEVTDHVYGAARFEVLPGDFYGVGRPAPAAGGTVFVDHDWSHE